jgi:hypothetical protein
MELSRDSLFDWQTPDGGMERLLWISSDKKSLVFIPVDDPAKGWPFLRPTARFFEAVDAGLVTPVLNEPRHLTRDRTRSALTERHRKARDEAFAVIDKLVTDPERRVFDPSQCGRLIRETAKAFGKSPSTVYKYLRRYWQRGQHPDALQPDLHRCGAPGKERRAGEVKRGRPGKNCLNLKPDDILDLPGLVTRLRAPSEDDSVCRLVASKLSNGFRKRISVFPDCELDPFRRALVRELNRVCQQALLYDEERFSRIKLSRLTKEYLADQSTPSRLRATNRLLLCDILSTEIRRPSILSGSSGEGEPQIATGRKEEYTHINLTSERVKMCVDALQEYHVEQGLPVPLAYRRMVREKYSDPVMEGKEVIKINVKPIGEIPTQGQFRFVFKKRFSPTKVRLDSMKPAQFDRHHRSLLGDESQKAFGPGVLYQIDSTAGDIYLVHCSNRSRLIGRPNVYLVVDTFSHMVVGFDVSLLSPQYYSAAMALFHAISDKTPEIEKLKRICRIPLGIQHWPAKGLPQKIYADKGELISKNSDQIIKDLKIGVGNAPSYRPDAKGIVEQQFCLKNKGLIKWLPGAVDHDREPDDPDYRTKAVLTLEEFRDLLRLAIVKHNMSSMQDYRLSDAMIEANVKPVPWEIWRWGMDKLTADLRFIDPVDAKRRILPQGNAVVTMHGLRFRGVHYTCALAERNNWFSDARIANGFSIPCNFHPDLVSEIYLNCEELKVPTIFAESENPRLITAHLTIADERYSRWSWADLDAWRRNRSHDAAKENHNDLELGVQFDDAVEGITMSAEALAKAHKKAAGGTNVKDQAAARDDQAEKERNAQNGTMSSPPPEPTKNSAPHSTESMKNHQKCSDAIQAALQKKGKK